MSFLCSYSGCLGAPAHDEARRLLEAIATTGEAISAMFALRKLDLTAKSRDEHLEQAKARYLELAT
jgi:hypothetical protein